MARMDAGPLTFTPSVRNGFPPNPALWAPDQPRERHREVTPDREARVRPGQAAVAPAKWSQTASRLHYRPIARHPVGHAGTETIVPFWVCEDDVGTATATLQEGAVHISKYRVQLLPGKVFKRLRVGSLCPHRSYLEIQCGQAGGGAGSGSGDKPACPARRPGTHPPGGSGCGQRGFAPHMPFMQVPQRGQGCILPSAIRIRRVARNIHHPLRVFSNRTRTYCATGRGSGAERSDNPAPRLWRDWETCGPHI